MAQQGNNKSSKTINVWSQSESVNVVYKLENMMPTFDNWIFSVLAIFGHLRKKARMLKKIGKYIMINGIPHT